MVLAPFQFFTLMLMVGRMAVFRMEYLSFYGSAGQLFCSLYCNTNGG